MKRIPELDGLRGIAILMVLVFHVAGATSPHGYRWAFYIKDVLALGWSGVDLFFVLSGFLIGGILLDARESPRYFQTFYARRAFRILPVYGAFMIAVHLLVGYVGRPSLSWYVYAAFAQNVRYAMGALAAPTCLAVTWSLAIEEQFYLVLPTVVRFVPRRLLAWVVGAGIVGAPVLRTLFVRLYSHGGDAAFALMPCRADALLLGVAVAMLVRGKREWLRAQRKWVAVMCVGLLGGLGLFVAGNQISEIGAPWISTVGFTWIAFMYACLLVLALVWADGWFGRVLRNRALRGLGTISYTLYLWHWMVVTVVFHGRAWTVETWSDAALMGVGVGGAIVLATASWRFFEKPLLAMGHRWKYEREITSRTLPPPAELAAR